MPHTITLTQLADLVFNLILRSQLLSAMVLLVMLLFSAALAVGSMALLLRLLGAQQKKWIVIICTAIALLFVWFEYIKNSYLAIYRLMDRVFMPIQTTKGFVVAALLSAVVFFGLMAFLHRMSPQVKRWTTIVLTFISGSYYLIEYLYPLHWAKVTSIDPDTGQQVVSWEHINFLTHSISPISDYVNNIFIWTIFLGLISLTIVHGQKLLRRESGWHNSLAFFIAAISMFFFGAISHMGKTTNDFLVRVVPHHTGSMGIFYNKIWMDLFGKSPHVGLNQWYNSLFNGLLMNFDSAMFALLAFYIVSAAYRAFRIRSLEATLLMVSALVVMLGMVDFGLMLTSGIPLTSHWEFLRIDVLSGWILSWVNMPAQRAVTIGVSVGGLAMALRLWLSLERGSFFSQE